MNARLILFLLCRNLREQSHIFASRDGAVRYTDFAGSRAAQGVTSVDMRSQLILWFTLGVALESLYLIRLDFRWGRLACCVAAGFIVYVMNNDKPGYDAPAQAQVGFLIFAFLFGWLYKEDILPVVSEKLLLALTVLFWYGFAAEFYRGTAGQFILMGLATVPSSLTVYAALMRPPMSFWFKLLLYTWFLVVLVSLGLFQFPFGNLTIFKVQLAVPWLEPIDALATGMAFVYLAVNATYLYLLVPIPGKGQSFSDRMKDWHQLTDLMTQRCSDEGPTHAQALWIVGILGGLVLGNYAYHWVPASLLISVALITSGFLLHVGTTKEALQAAPAAESSSGRAVQRAARKRGKAQRMV